MQDESGINTVLIFQLQYLYSYHKYRVANWSWLLNSISNTFNSLKFVLELLHYFCTIVKKYGIASVKFHTCYRFNGMQNLKKDRLCHPPFHFLIIPVYRLYVHVNLHFIGFIIIHNFKCNNSILNKVKKRW